jgi:hypothetical protein
MLKISAKCADAFCADLYNDAGILLKEYQGYVTKLLPPDHDGFHDPDHVGLEIDLETGQILNWKRPTKKQIDDFIKGKETD